ncbi:MAG: DUF3386 family protein [Gemmataceae bacterium]
MKRFVAPLVALVAFLSAASAQAHFIWIVPADAKAQVVFSEELAPDANVDIQKIAATKLMTRQASGEAAPLDWSKAENAFEIKVPASGTVGGTCKYGVLQRGDSKPFLLVYYPKLITGKVEAVQPWKQLAFEIVPQGNGQFQALFNGKPVAEAEVAVISPAGKQKASTDAQGKFKIEATTPGSYGLRVRHVEAAPGNLDGKKYDEARHYATLVFQVGGKSAAKADVAENPEATKLLAEARAHRAEWEGFQGFSANIEVNIDGELSKGTVKVDAKGKCQFEGLSKPAADWADRFLESLVAHRRASGSERTTPATFVDNKDHPQGRLVRLLGDGLHSTYRIRDKQIMVVNRNMGGVKFTINVIENATTKEGKFMPTSWTVTYWDVKTGAVKRTIVNHVTWERIGSFDLPVAARTITTSPDSENGGVSTASLKLSNYKLEK